eukprot:8916523-Pyramimonas_sp.AAC.1
MSVCYLAAGGGEGAGLAGAAGAGHRGEGGRAADVSAAGRAVRAGLRHAAGPGGGAHEAKERPL